MWKSVAALVVALFLLTASGIGAVPAAVGYYRLGAGDELRIRVFAWHQAVGEVSEWSALKGKYLIGPDGTLPLPVIGTIPAAGSTVEDLAAAIGARLQHVLGLASRPQALVSVLKFRPFYILGDVNHPGGYPYQPGLTVLQAASVAGGLFRVTAPVLLDYQRQAVATASDLRVQRQKYAGLLALLALLRNERGRVDLLIKRGLTTTPQEFELRKSELVAEAELSETAERVKADAAVVRQDAIAGPELAAFGGQQTDPPTYLIFRRNAAGVQEIQANEQSAVEPGDTIEVKRAKPAAAVSALPSHGSSLDGAMAALVNLAGPTRPVAQDGSEPANPNERVEKHSPSPVHARHRQFLARRRNHQ
jgi:protein involved in polysaccharide export with SLBB domain